MKVVYDSFEGRCSDSPRALHAWMRARRPQDQPVWLCDPRHASTFPSDVATVPTGGSEAVAALESADLVVGNTHLELDWVEKPGARYLQTWHGTPLKRIHHDSLWAPPGKVAEGTTAVLHAPTWRDREFYRPGVVEVSRHPEVHALYRPADVLVTDYSSVMFDFAITGKPLLLFYAYDLEAYRDDLRGFYVDLEEVAPGPVVRTTDEVADALVDLPGLRLRHADGRAAERLGPVFHETARRAAPRATTGRAPERAALRAGARLTSGARG
ncbi:CDP-Glycerol:Poly(glycerophosphate) glycerophosphotransferase [Friedmanniella luteola]|uniref:CDP-Glycerol:Poly(Glycerophosphate) glycerophosphotransferase n=1 Tax=Friedmanniella luteola TaxID=546871 RepID=A0A1H1NRK7_9ACTN|nr:CDP-glycerol glycerophosphotransferase family protein [Friedmanniella luteola]SDS01430.1 CDP-Glycerol:Poly(glycerophosphate) glycerophosphotransferase [Friedmanniella luteola]